MAKIKGIEGMTDELIMFEVQNGAKFVIYEYCISALIVTFRRSSDVYFIRPGESAVAKGMPYTLLSLVAGWWGFPFGFIYTPMSLYTNLRGGKNVTAQIVSAVRTK